MFSSSTTVLFLGYFVLLVGLVASDPSICRILSLGGGGDRGAYQAGAFKALVELSKNKEDVQYDLISGISVGSINSAALVQFSKGQEEAAKNYLIPLWKSIKASDVWKNWVPGGIAEGFLLKSGLLDTSPLRTYLKTHLNMTAIKNSDRELLIGASSLTSNSFREFNSSAPDLTTAIMASSAIPGLFPAIDIDGVSYVDGGVNYMTPITGSIEECRSIKKKQMGSKFNPDEMQIQVDVILCIGDATVPAFIEKTPITPLVIARTFFLLVNNIFVKDIQSAKIAYPQAEIRVIKPSKWLKGEFIFFQHNEENMQIGYDDAKKIIQQTR